MVETLLALRGEREIDEIDSVHLLGRAVHRMRNMMMSVRGYAELIASGEGDRALQQRWAGRIVEQLDRLESMHARLDGAQLRSNATGLHSLALVVRAAIERSRQRHGDRIAIELETHTDLLLEIQGEALREAVCALIDNAIEAQLESGRRTPVCVRIADEPGVWTITIEDQGDGIVVPVGERMGEPFFTRKPGHLGLGLYLSRTLLARHGLTLDLGSAPHGGTVATIRGRKNPSGGER